MGRNRRGLSKWRDLRRRMLLSYGSTLGVGLLLALLPWFNGRVAGVLWVAVGSCSIVFHWYLVAFQCPRCGNSYALKSLWRPDWSVVIPPARCAHCRLKRGAPGY